MRENEKNKKKEKRENKKKSDEKKKYHGMEEGDILTVKKINNTF